MDVEGWFGGAEADWGGVSEGTKEHNNKTKLKGHKTYKNEAQNTKIINKNTNPDNSAGLNQKAIP